MPRGNDSDSGHSVEKLRGIIFIVAPSSAASTFVNGSSTPGILWLDSTAAIVIGTADTQKSLISESATDGLPEIMSVSIEDGISSVEQPPSKKLPQFSAILLATLPACSIGTYLSWSSPALSLYKEDKTLTIDNQQGSWMSAMLPFGAIIGSVPANLIADIFGRKNTIWFMMLPLFSCWFIIAFNDDIICIYCARLLAGVASGVVSIVIPMYLSEITEPSISGSLSTVFQLQIMFGILYAYTAGFTGNLLSIAMLCAVIPGFLLIIFPFMPESPMWLISKNRKKEADYSIRRLRGRDYRTENILTRLEEDRETHADRIGILGLGSYGQPLIITIGLTYFQQLSGVNALIFYAREIFEKTGSTIPPNESTVVVGILLIIASYLSSILIARNGRKILLFISAALMAVCMFVLSAYFRFLGRYDISSYDWVPLLAFGGYLVIFSIGFGPIPWLMLGELFPDNAKHSIRTLTAVCHWSMCFLVTKCFQDMIDMLGNSTTFATFGMLCLAGMLFAAIVVPETKDKTVRQIHMELYGMRTEDTESLKSGT